MSAHVTADRFLSCLSKSGLLEARRLDPFLSERRAAGTLPADSKELAALLVAEGLLTPFQAGHLLKGRYKNFHVGKYRLLEPIGSGGTSRVYLCEHTVMGHRVAMKVLPLNNKAAGSVVERFYREARAVAGLHHPNVVRAHDIDRYEDQFCYLIMDFVDGVSLQELVRDRGPLSARRAANYAAQAAAGLQHLHEASFVHRDIKPGNLLLDREGVVKILDLGLARSGGEGESLTQAFDEHAILGTADYISPEQALKTHDVDIRADLYSLGATLYYLLTGTPPFGEETVTQKLIAHQMREPRPLATLRPDVPAGLAAAVARLMAKSPADRPATPAEAAALLAEWAAPVPAPDAADFPARSTATLRPPVSPTSTLGSAAHTMRRPPSGRVPALPAERPSKTLTPAAPAPDPKATQPVPIPRKRSRVGLIVGAAVAVLAGGAALAAYLGVGSDVSKPIASGAPERAAAKAEPVAPVVIPEGALVVTADGRPGSFPTVAAAVAAARPGGRIVLVDAEHREQLALASPPAGLTVEGLLPGGARVRWSAPEGRNPERPLIDLTHCDGLRFRHVRADGGGRLDAVVRVSGTCAGTVLHDLEVVGSSRAGLVLAGVSGVSGQPLVLDRVRLVADRELPAAIDVEAATPGPDALGARHVRLTNGRVEGPWEAALRFRAGAAEVEVRTTRVFRAGDGVRYAPTAGRPALGLSLVKNTFSECQRGLNFAVPPPAGPALVVQNNLFENTGRLADTAGVALAPDSPPGEWVWYDEGKKGNAVYQIPAEPRHFRRSFKLDRAPASATLDVGGDDSYEAWVNGKPAGKSPAAHFTQSVQRFDVTGLLRAGDNVIAIRVKNELDQVNPAYATVAGVLAVLTDRSGATPRVVVATDGAWRAAKSSQAGEGWREPGFDDSAWKPALEWAGNPVVWPWQNAVWEGAVAESLRSAGVPPVAVAASGNVRDYRSWEGYPLLGARRGVTDDRSSKTGTDPSDDGAFLRYPASSPLARAGAGGRPAGVPPLDP